MVDFMVQAACMTSFAWMFAAAFIGFCLFVGTASRAVKRGEK